MNSARQLEPDIVKAAAIVAIVLVHADAVLPGPGRIGFGSVASVALALFFLVSGHVAGRRLLAPNADVRDVAARVVPLLWLYLLWQPVVLAQRMLLNGLQVRPFDPVGEASRFLAAPVRPNGELWYLWALAIHLVVIAATRRARPVVVLGPAVAVFVLCNGFGRMLLGDDGWHLLGPGLQGMPQFVFFTLLGARLRTLRPAQRPEALVVIALCAVLCSVGLHGLSSAVTATPPLETLAGVVAALALAHLIAPTWTGAVLGFIGQRSTAPYLTHMSILTLLVGALVLTGRTPTGGGRLPALAVMVALAVLVPVMTLDTVENSRFRWLFRTPSVIEEAVIPAVPIVIRRWSKHRTR